MDTIPLQKDCQNLYKTNPATNSRTWRRQKLNSSTYVSRSIVRSMYTAKNQQPEEPPDRRSVDNTLAPPDNTLAPPDNTRTLRRRDHAIPPPIINMNLISCPPQLKTLVLPPSAWLLHPIGMGERMMMMMMNSPPLSTMIPTTHQVRGRVTATRRLLQRHQSVLPIHLLALLRRQAVIMRLLQFLPPVRHVNTVQGRGRGQGRRSAIDII